MQPLFPLQFGCFTAISFILYLHQFSLALWIGSGAFGLFMSSVFPSTLSLAEHYIDVTGKLIPENLMSSFTMEFQSVSPAKQGVLSAYTGEM